MPESGSETPAIRASDDEREAVVARLRTAAGEGRLALERSPDIVDCGSGVDRILADDSDDVTGCERTASNR